MKARLIRCFLVNNFPWYLIHNLIYQTKKAWLKLLQNSANENIVD